MDQATINAMLTELRAKVEYLEQRNLALSVAVQNLSTELATYKNREQVDETESQ